MDLHTAVSVSMLAVSRGRAAAIFKDLRDSPDAIDGVLDASGIDPAGRAAMADAARFAADAALRAAPAAGMEPIPWFDVRYPFLLSCIVDPPPVLWTRGDPAVLARPAVAVVGSRAATSYALDVGERLGSELADRGIVVASGLARGVDSAAHRGCLDARGLTAAVLGSGLDTIYPPEHEELAATIARRGVLVSELGPGAPPLPDHFPLRNRIISGLSLGVVIVEASEKSGSLITARCAMEQGRDVMAVPGSVLSGRNRGSHALLKDGAKVVETADDILEELGWPGAARTVQSDAKLLDSDPLLEKLDAGETYGLDELVEATGIAPSRLLPRLMELELRGQVLSAAGGRFRRVVT
ncbi:MAG: DNA protecting protein DprA [Acidobacteria bacterium RIFCSPLOWO2_02_FULL_67_36]|nr:MAG: DNA protecting protein DprA [Acidobacteria bacterium RIFCSPLOWO2_02_FULL_67_36]OFW25776.1 MAG: DNA protecting protein DprA [Acidobacteria bacterium RIFCSPLOWO2_12_FULL_66_21]